MRELENIIERAVALTDSETITQADLPEDIRRLEFDTLEGGGLPTLAEMERHYVIKILEKRDIIKSLRLKCWACPALHYGAKLKEYGVE